MKVVTSILLLAVSLTADVALTSPVHSRYSYAIKDSHRVPDRWSRVGPAPAEHWINLNIGLKQDRFGELERQLYEGITYTTHRFLILISYLSSVHSLPSPLW